MTRMPWPILSSFWNCPTRRHYDFGGGHFAPPAGVEGVGPGPVGQLTGTGNLSPRNCERELGFQCLFNESPIPRPFVAPIPKTLFSFFLSLGAGKKGCTGGGGPLRPFWRPPPPPPCRGSPTLTPFRAEGREKNCNALSE